MNRRNQIAIALTLTLLGMPACDKGEAGDAKKSGEAQEPADSKTTAEQPKPGDAKPGDAKPADAAEVAADGRVEISVDASGYHPETISAPAKSKITLAFKRTTDSGCGQELVIEALEIKKDLPLDEVVEIQVEVPETGELKFACGMDMYRGKVVPKA